MTTTAWGTHLQRVADVWASSRPSCPSAELALTRLTCTCSRAGRLSVPYRVTPSASAALIGPTSSLVRVRKWGVLVWPLSTNPWLCNPEKGCQSTTSNYRHRLYLHHFHYHPASACLHEVAQPLVSLSSPSPRFVVDALEAVVHGRRSGAAAAVHNERHGLAAVVHHLQQREGSGRALRFL